MLGLFKTIKVKYRKRLVKYVLARTNEFSSVMQIINDVNILMPFRWAQETWKKVSGTAIRNFFEKCGIMMV